MSEHRMVISVIVPCYNVEKYIARCLDSLVKQDVAVKYEVVVVNDGTKDKAAIIAEEYAQRYPRLIRVLHKENGGLSSARNFGINNSDSEFLAFVDSDDYVSTDYLSTLYDSLVTNDADISMCGIIKTQSDDYAGKRFDSGFTDNLVINDVRALISKSSFAAWNKMYKRSLFENIRYPEGITYEDYATTPRLFMKAKKVVYNNRPCYYYYSNPESIIGSMKNKIDWNILKAFAILKDSGPGTDQFLINTLYERRVIQSLAKTVIDNGSRQQLLTLYNDMQVQGCISREVLTKDLGCFDRIFVTQFKKGHLMFCYILQKTYSLSRKILLMFK